MSLPTSTHKKTTHTKTAPSTSHPRVKHLLQHAVNRVVKLLNLYDHRINQLSEHIDIETTSEPEAQVKADKTLLSLSRMILNLHKDLHQNTALLYPSRMEQRTQAGQNGIETVPQTLAQLTCVDNEQTNLLEASETSGATDLNIEELTAVLEEARESVNQFAHALHLPPIALTEFKSQCDDALSEIAMPETNTLLHTKQQKKQQKFSNSFFKKQVAQC
jgi:hypothetical protein